MKPSSLLPFLFFFTTIFLFGQEKNAHIIYDANKNKTHIINLLVKDTLTIEGNWKEVKKIKNKFDVNYHFIGFKNNDDNFIEIAVNLKRKTQFYSNSTSDIELLKTSKEFESYRNKVNYNSFNFLKSDNKTYYSFFIENKKILKTTLIGIIQDYYLEINYYPSSTNEPGKVDKLIELFQSIKLN